MRAPEFWTEDGLRAHLLAPLGWSYASLGRLRRGTARPRQAPVPLICVGELTVGGSGKTPTALAIGERLIAGGRRPHFLSRGYRGREPGPLRVDPAKHDARAVGDEPLLLAAVAPTWVAADRAAGADAAVRAGAELLIMDDGLQNLALRPDLALLVVDGAYGFGNRRVLPAGPLRESTEDGLARVQAVIRVGPDRIGIEDGLPPHLPRLEATLAPGPAAPDLSGRRVVAFAGIGRPAKFFQSLSAAGAEVVAAHAFPDHHPYRPHEIVTLLAAARCRGALCVTTAKDLVRLPGDLRAEVATLPVRLAFADPAALDRLIEPALESRRITL